MPTHRSTISEPGGLVLFKIAPLKREYRRQHRYNAAACLRAPSGYLFVVDEQGGAERVRERAQQAGGQRAGHVDEHALGEEEGRQGGVDVAGGQPGEQLGGPPQVGAHQVVVGRVQLAAPHLHLTCRPPGRRISLFISDSSRPLISLSVIFKDGPVEKLISGKNVKIAFSEIL